MIPVTECRTANDVRSLARAIYRRRHNIRPRFVPDTSLAATAAKAQQEPQVSADSLADLPVLVARAPTLFDTMADDIAALILDVDESLAPPSAKFLLAYVSNKFHLSPIELLSKRRHAPLIAARRLYCWLARNMTHKSLPEIGRSLGGKDHTTVLHHCNVVDQWQAECVEYAAYTDALASEAKAAWAVHKSRQSRAESSVAP